MKLKNIYVLCPAGLKSGGADALHQLVYYLNRQNVCAKIVYTKGPYTNNDFSIPERYKTYVEDFLLEQDIVDSPENAVVITESFTKMRNQFENVKIYIWWLGINDNLTYGFLKKSIFLATLPVRMLTRWSCYKNRTFAIVKSVLNKEIYSFSKELSRVTHLCASYNAYNYVSNRSRNMVLLCIEPISKKFLDVYEHEKNHIVFLEKKDVVLYNPARNYTSIINKLSDYSADLKFEPLQGLNQQQLIEKYKTAKLYVDFGSFPGAERIPKEAVLFGCAIITGKRGASGYHGDVPIPEEYKFGDPENQIEEIAEKIRLVLKNYQQIYSDFDEYRNTVLNLEENFIKSLKEIFLQ